jgi:hypothetical protein
MGLLIKEQDSERRELGMTKNGAKLRGKRRRNLLIMWELAVCLDSYENDD